MNLANHKHLPDFFFNFLWILNLDHYIKRFTFNLYNISKFVISINYLIPHSWTSIKRTPWQESTIFGFVHTKMPRKTVSLFEELFPFWRLLPCSCSSPCYLKPFRLSIPWRKQGREEAKMAARMPQALAFVSLVCFVFFRQSHAWSNDGHYSICKIAQVSQRVPIPSTLILLIFPPVYGHWSRGIIRGSRGWARRPRMPLSGCYPNRPVGTWRACAYGPTTWSSATTGLRLFTTLTLLITSALISTPVSQHIFIYSWWDPPD